MESATQHLPAVARQARLMRAVVYIRVSKVGARGDELLSPEIQLHQARQHAGRNGYEIVAVVEDINKSGRDFSKRRVAEIIERIKAGEFEVVIVWMFSRWGRDTLQNLEWLARVEEAGGRVESAMEPFDSKTAFGEWNRTMVLANAQLQSRQIGDNWRQAHDTRRRIGLPHNALPRFGYTYDRAARRYDVNDVEAEILRDAYLRFVRGEASFRGLAMEWNERGIKTARGEKWVLGSVRFMMDGGFAAGLIRERSAQPKPGQPNSKRMCDFDVWRPGAHESIVSADVWGRYRALRLNAANEPARRVPRFGLSGILFCHFCGDTLKRNVTRGGKYCQWVCHKGRDRHHRPVTISERIAERAILEWMQGLVAGGEATTEEVGQALDRQALERREVTDVKAAWRRVTKERNRLQKLWLAGDFEEDFYRTEKARLDAELAELAAKSARAERGDLRYRQKPTIEAVREVAEHWRRWSPQRQRKVLGELLSGVVVSPGRGMVFVPAFC